MFLGNINIFFINMWLILLFFFFFNIEFYKYLILGVGINKDLVFLSFVFYVDYIFVKLIVLVLAIFCLSFFFVG